MNNTKLKKALICAMLAAIGLILPFVTGQIRLIGNMLLPMHLPIMLCGFICGPWYGLLSGFLLPIARSVLFGMPVMYPNAIGMAFELATYGSVTGLIYNLFAKKNTLHVYIALVVAMLSGRLVWALAQIILLGLSGKKLLFPVFVTKAFGSAIPGIVLQLVLIPIILAALKRAGFIEK